MPATSFSMTHGISWCNADADNSAGPEDALQCGPDGRAVDEQCDTPPTRARQPSRRRPRFTYGSGNEARQSVHVATKQCAWVHHLTQTHPPPPPIPEITTVDGTESCAYGATVGRPGKDPVLTEPNPSPPRRRVPRGSMLFIICSRRSIFVVCCATCSCRRSSCSLI